MTLSRAFLDRPITHRGLHDLANGIAENSRDAFEAAIAAGFGIECDLQLSKDEHAMVFHDYGLGRLTEDSGPVRQRDMKSLQKTQLLGSKNTIDTLPDILALVSARVPLLIELKDQDGAMGPNVGILEQRTADALKDYNGDVAVMSFNPHSTKWMSDLMPHIPCGITTSAYDPDHWPLTKARCAQLRDIPDYDASGACFISHEANDLDRARVTELKSKGAAVLCWTIRSQAQADDALKRADNITFEGYVPA
ncbi:glycerophosphodiester phosphodiesterase family protein [Litoreibacter sp.]|nr:glycerophosphodiester phosphodiesterase family protein [Litoreibacter sp.]